MKAAKKIGVLWTLASAFAAAQSNCPYAVPSSIQMVVSRDLPPGSRPYVRQATWIWILCDTAPLGQGIAIHVAATGPLAFGAGASMDARAYAESDPLSHRPAVWMQFISTTMDPDPGTQHYSIAVSVPGGSSISVPVSVTFTGAPYIEASDSIVSFELPQGADPALIDSQINDEYFWFANSSAPLTLNIAAESSGWLSVNPRSGTGYTLIAVRGDPGNLNPGTYWGSLTVTASGAVNSPLKIPVRLTVRSPGGANVR